MTKRGGGGWQMQCKRCLLIGNYGSNARRCNSCGSELLKIKKLRITKTQRLTEKLGNIQAIHAIVCDKNKESDRAGDVIVSLQIDGKWYEVIRLTEACNYFSGEITRAGLANHLAQKNARTKPTKGDNWIPLL